MSATLLQRDFNTVDFLWNLQIFQEHLQWLLLRFKSCFQRSPEQKPVRLSAINTIFSRRNVLDARKIQKQTPQVFCKRSHVTLLLERGSIIIVKFLRTLTLKNICERLLVKISISVRNSEVVAQRSSVKKMFLEILQNSQ